MTQITQDLIDQAQNYHEFREMTDKLLENNKTTGDNHSEALVNYTKMNVHRMKRLDKKPELTDELKNALSKIKTDQIWFVIAEAWCGDVAQNLPTIQKMVDESNHVEMKIILRDEYPEIIEKYAYNNTLSIPRIIALDKNTLEELWVWGPRPRECQELMEELKQNNDMDQMQKAEQIHKWYASNKTKMLQSEFQKLISG